MEFTDPAPADLRDAGVRRWIRDTLSTTVARHGTAPGGPVDIDPLDRFGAVRAPTLVVSGTLDSTDHRWIAGRIAAAIPGARTVDVEAAHMINLDAPDRFAAVLREFLHATAPKGSWDALPVRDWLRIEQAARVVPRYAPVEAGRLAYEVRGEGPPVVLLHGGMLDMHMWDAETALLERSHRVIRFDARGHGLSSTRDGDHRPAQDVRDLLDRLGVERAPLVGLSLGARVAADRAVTDPERVTALLLASPGISGMMFDDPALGAARDAHAAAIDEP
jgi:pimeloyl-ACP methyl ester carboxylesterase